MAYKPLHDKLIVQRLEEQEKSAGGIIIPDTAKETTGRLLPREPELF